MRTSGPRAPGRSVLAVAGSLILAGVSARGATAFQVAYLSTPSGAAGGGAAVAIVGNQFQAGATAAVGGVGVPASVASATRIAATMPALSPGTLHDVSVANPGGSTSTLPKAWFADFLDVPQASAFHAPVETIVRDGITSGCGAGNFCPSSAITRAQMAVFLLRAEHGGAYTPPPATGTVFADVPSGSFAADWIEQLYAEGVTGGCGTGPLRYCPASPVTRGQMAVFLLKVYHGVSYAPPPAQGVFGDVSPSSPLAPWIEELSRLAITSGCGGASYCPGSSVTRGQMAVFMAKTFHRAEAVRFLEQASWGPTDAEIGNLLGLGYLPWLAAQFSAPASSYPALALWPGDVPDSCDDDCRLANYSMYPLQTRFFRNAMYGPDQLRQRVAWSLHKLTSVSADTIYMPSRMSPYLRLLDQRAFGTYRNLLEGVTLNPAMGEFLNMATSTKYDPNENYAREILQLFAIGTEMLHPDGTVQTDGETGLPLPSYDQSVIDQLKLVFTGWSIPEVPCPAPNGSEDCWDYIAPMSHDPDLHDTQAKTLFAGFLPTPTVIPAGQPGAQDLSAALDAIFDHPNVGPYLARELIHSLVTSNPSPAYVERVAGFFADNGAGQRGNLWAVVKAILLDPEARRAPVDPAYGKLREPVLYVAGILRAFDARGADRSTLSDGNLAWECRQMGQNPFRPPSVFSYFPQAYNAPPASAGVLGPEFGIMNAKTSLQRSNFVNLMTFWGGLPVEPQYDLPLGTSLDFSELELLAPSPANLVDRLDRLLLHGTMSDALRGSIVAAVAAVDPSDPRRRANQALYLVAVSSQYQVQR